MPEAKRRPGPIPKISREAVLDVARRLRPEEVTLAAIGAKLGVTGPAIYRYFTDRTAILEALANEAREKLTPPDADLPWDLWLRESAKIERALWRTYPNLYESANYRAMSRPMLRMTQAGLQVLTAAGFSTEDAFCGLTIISELAHSMGWAETRVEPLYDPADIDELLAPMLTSITEPITLDAFTERSLDIAIEGLRARLPASSRRRSAFTTKKS